MYTGNEYGAAASVPPGQVPLWDPTMQAGRSSYISAPGTFPGQNYASSSVPAYTAASMPAGSSALAQTGSVASAGSSTITSQLVGPGGASPPGVRPGGVPPPGQPPYYGQ